MILILPSESFDSAKIYCVPDTLMDTIDEDLRKEFCQANTTACDQISREYEY